MSIKFPFGAATVIALAYAANLTPTIDNTRTMINCSLTGDAGVNLQPDPEIMIGSEVIARFTADGTNRTVTPGANHTGLAIAVNANKIVLVTFIWDGSKFLTKSSVVLN
jgi:hypothetical protein